MSEGVTRRALLGSLCGATAAASAGTRVAGERTQATETWPTFGFDEANSGYAPDHTGPVENVGGRWQFETDGAVASSAAVVDGTVYVGDDRGNLYALSTTDGSEEWTFEAGGQVASSPAVVDETIYVGSSDNNVYALDRADGTIRWQYETQDQVISSPTVVDGTVYVGSQDYSIYALNAADGSVEWSARTGNAVTATPAVVDGTVYVASEDRFVYALDADGGEPQWRYQTEGSVSAAVAVDPSAGLAVAGSLDGTVYALDTASGELAWEFETGGPVVGSPAVAEGTVYFGSRDSTLYAVDRETGEEVWAFETDLRVTGTPSVAGDVVYVGDQIGNVYGVDAAEGRGLWQFEASQGITAAPAVVDGVVYIGSESEQMYALAEGAALSTPTPAPNGGDEEGSGISILTFLGLPAAALAFTGLIVGFLYAASRLGAFSPIEDAAPEPPPFEEIMEEEEPPEEDGDPAIWEVVLKDVIGRAEETTRTATEDLLVTKHVDPDSLSAPMVAYEIESMRSEPATVRLSEPIDPADADPEAIGNLPGGEGWEIDDDRLVFETTVEPGRTARTLLARRDLDADDEALVAAPTVDVPGA